MTKEKLISLEKYLQDCKNKLESKEVPEKHKHRTEAYRSFLKNEIRNTQRALDKIKEG